MPKPPKSTPNLAQADFAARLTEGLEDASRRGILAKDVADKAGWDETTLSRWKREDYKPGPPKEAKRRQLEGLLGIPHGYLDRSTGDLRLLRKGQTPVGHSADESDGAHGGTGQPSPTLGGSRATDPQVPAAQEEHVVEMAADAVRKLVRAMLAQDEIGQTRDGREKLARELERFAGRVNKELRLPEVAFDLMQAASRLRRGEEP